MQVVQFFDDLLDANRRYAEGFALRGLPAPAAKGFALVSCMDSRIDPLSTFGLHAGDSKILRNAGGRVTDDVLRSLIMGVTSLNIHRIAVMQHTSCAMIASNESLQRSVEEASGASAEGWDFLPITDPDTTLAADVERVRSCPLIADRIKVVGWRYDIDSGLVHQIIS